MRDYSEFLGDDTFAIFLFHNVIWSRKTWRLRNLNRKALHLHEFKEVIVKLINNGAPVSTDDIVNGNVPPKAWAVTFDDAFAGAYWYGAPFLEELGVPATFYITTNFVNNNSKSWADQLEVNFETSDLSVEAFQGLKAFIKGSKHVDPYSWPRWIEELGFKSDIQLDEKMSWEMVKELSECPLFMIGGHGVSHRIIEYLSWTETAHEIWDSIRGIENKTGLQIRHFSYPEGLLSCWSQETEGILKEANIVCCPTAQEGVNRIGDSLFKLKRIMVI
jgi:peptidoglycan/xylan/chitin deacetylase (PgdA/CDA1 family)